MIYGLLSCTLLWCCFESVDEILKCDHSNESYRAALSFDAVYYVVKGCSQCNFSYHHMALLMQSYRKHTRVCRAEGWRKPVTSVQGWTLQQNLRFFASAPNFAIFCLKAARVWPDTSPIYLTSAEFTLHLVFTKSFSQFSNQGKRKNSCMIKYLLTELGWAGWKIFGSWSWHTGHLEWNIFPSCPPTQSINTW